MPSTWSQDGYRKAYLFAARAHEGQLYPGTQISYVMHLSFVSMEVLAALQIEDGRHGDLAVQSALLHDVLEDTQTPEGEIRTAFGEDVARGVCALTKDSRLEKALQMRDSLRRIRELSPEIAMVKMADRISNLGQPPSCWTAEKIRNYREEAEEILACLQSASSYLAARLRSKIDAYGY